MRLLKALYAEDRRMVVAGVSDRYSDLPILQGTTLYGTTRAGGSSDNGTLFKLNTDGSGFTVLKHFTSVGFFGAGPSGPPAR